MSDRRWMVMVRNQLQGPYSDAALLEMLQGGRLNDHSAVRVHGDPDAVWAKLGQVRGSLQVDPLPPTAAQPPSPPAVAQPHTVITPRWQVVISGEIVGPLSQAQLAELQRTNQIGPHTLARKEGTAPWQELGLPTTDVVSPQMPAKPITPSPGPSEVDQQTQLLQKIAWETGRPHREKLIKFWLVVGFLAVIFVWSQLSQIPSRETLQREAAKAENEAALKVYNENLAADAKKLADEKLARLTSAVPPIDPDPLFQPVAQFTDDSGVSNRVRLYALTGRFDVERFTEFCRRQREDVLAVGEKRMMHYTVVFDRVENVVRPARGLYSMYWNPNGPWQHIAADFEFSPVTGLAEGSVHLRDINQGKPLRIKL